MEMEEVVERLSDLMELVNMAIDTPDIETKDGLLVEIKDELSGLSDEVTI